MKEQHTALLLLTTILLGLIFAIKYIDAYSNEKIQIKKLEIEQMRLIEKLENCKK